MHLSKFAILIVSSVFASLVLIGINQDPVVSANSIEANQVESAKVDSSKNDGNASEGSKPDLTYASDIAPIIMNRCASCHQAGGIAPFSLTTFEDLKKRSSTIDAVVATKTMPPWKPTPGYGDFLNARCMSDDEISSIRNWIKQGAAPGDLSKAPKLAASQMQSGSEWRNGKPDLIVRMPQAYKVKADGPDIYRCFVFPLNVSENKFVSNVEFHPGNPKVLHHALFFLDNMGAARKKDEADPEPGFASFGGPGFMPTGSLGGWAPGNSMLPLPDGVARLIRKDSDLVIQMHFHPDGKEELAQGELGIYFSKKPPRTFLLPMTLRSRKIDIPADEKNYRVSATSTVPADLDLLQITPHAHLLCKEIKCHAKTPSGEDIPLIWIKNWDFNWQEQYGFKKPVHLPAGTVVQAEFVYDNSNDNFRNPNHPPKRVSWGEQTTDEMALIFGGGIVSNNDDMQKYMRGLLFQNLKDLPRLGASPGNALKVMKLLTGSRSGLLKQLGKATPEESSGSNN